MKTILPAGLWYGLREIWSLADGAGDRPLPPPWVFPARGRFLNLLEKQRRQGGYPRPAGRLERRGGNSPCKAHEKGGDPHCARRMPSGKIADKSHRMVELAVEHRRTAYALTEPKRRSAPARYEVVHSLGARRDGPRAAEVSYYTGASARTLRTMEKAGLIAFSEEEELRVPSLDDVEPGPEIVLNEEQQRAFEEILGRVPGGKAVGHAAAGRYRQRQDPGLSATGAGNAGAGKNRHGAGAGDRADAADDAEILLLLRAARWPCSTAPCG